MLLNNEEKSFSKTCIFFKTTHRLHSSSLFSVCIHRNFSAKLCDFFKIFFFFPWHCKYMCLNLLCCNLVTSLWPECNLMYTFLTGRNCQYNWPPVVTALPSSPEQHLGVCISAESWQLLPYPWHGSGSRRSSSAPPTTEFQFLGQTCCFQAVTLTFQTKYQSS